MGGRDEAKSKCSVLSDNIDLEDDKKAELIGVDFT